MQRIELRTAVKLLGAAAVTLSAGLLCAQAGYPGKPIKIIAPVQPGGGAPGHAFTALAR